MTRAAWGTVRYEGIGQSVIDRFWDKVDKSAGVDGCWEWTAFRNRNGYGMINIDRIPALAHRVALALSTGTTGIVAMHSCDNPACVNPKHLSWSDQTGNVADMHAKGRHRCGPGMPGGTNPSAKLTADQVDEIRRRSILGESHDTLAQQFGVRSRTISDVVAERTWKRVAA